MTEAARKIMWEPTPKQAEALSRCEFEVLYGGARGGGKTDAGLVKPLYNKDNPLYKGLVIRRNTDDLIDWVERAKRMYAGTSADFTGKPAMVRWPSGAYLRTGHLKDEDAYEKYQGHEYHDVIIEELTQIPSEERYEKLISCCRSTVDGIQAQVFATTNPGGPGHKWVKRRFVDPSIPGRPFVNSKTGRSAVFIQSTVDDNPHILTKDPEYVTYLDNLRGDLRKAWREGSWDLEEIAGSVYGVEMKDAWKSGRVGRVPYDPASPVHTAWDFGIDDSMSIIFWQKVGQEIRDIDYYENSHFGFKHYAEIMQKRGYVYGYHFGPHDLAVTESTGNTRKSTAASLGINFIVLPRVRDKVDGLEMVRNLLPYCWFDLDKSKQLIEALECYRYEWDENRQVFSNHPLHDSNSHAADAKQTQAQAMEYLKSLNSYGGRSKNKWAAAGGYGG